LFFFILVYRLYIFMIIVYMHYAEIE
jgi:hypothetical protein